jgi:tyrosyl-tRNA synthetase
MKKVVEELKRRGLFNQSSTEQLEEFFQQRARTIYFGMDPTADSLHIGNLAGIMTMRHLAQAGHSLIFLIGGGTGMIGDPSGKSDERNLLDDKTVAANAKAISKQLTLLLAGQRFRMLNNHTWLKNARLIEFLRDIGKHFTVNSMIKRDVIRPRLETAGASISYTEFSYLLLQAYDFFHLNQTYKVDVQVGGSDQWGNIISGVELIRRKLGKEVAAFTVPLIIDKTTGKKFGKSEGNAIWLDPKKTSPYSFYQFWLNVSDPNVFDYLKVFTFLPVSEIEALERESNSHERFQRGKKLLAYEVTKLVHGMTVAERVKAVSEIVFGERIIESLTKAEKDVLTSAVPTIWVTKRSVEIKEHSIIDLLLETKLAVSKSEARSFIEQGGVTLNGRKIEEVGEALSNRNMTGSMAMLRRGKKQYACIAVK